MALKMDDVSPQLAFKFTSSSFDPEKCKHCIILSTEIITFVLFYTSILLVCSYKVSVEGLTICKSSDQDCRSILDVRDLSAQCDTDAELQDHRKRIQTLSEETAVSLKKNVYKNYMQFIETSKEISCIL